MVAASFVGGAMPSTSKSYKRHPLTFPRSLLDFLLRHSEAFRLLPEKQRYYFGGMLYAAHFKPQRHAEEPDLQAHHWRERWQACRGTHQWAYGALGWWVKAREEDHMKHSAAGYRLTPEGQEMLDHWLDSLEDHVSPGIIDAHGGEVRQPKVAINPRTMTGKNAKRAPSLRVPVEIDANNLLHLQGAADAWLMGESSPPGMRWAYEAWDALEQGRGPNCGRKKAEDRVRKVKAQAGIMIAEAACTRAPGHVLPQTYIEAQSGRLYAERLINLQNCRREVKRAALPGQWEYDFENCHWGLLHQMAANQGIQLSAVADYLANKAAWRQEIALAAGISVEDAKRCIIALVYGAGLRADPRLAIPEIIGVEATQRLRQCQRMRDLHADVKQAADALIRAHQTQQGLINAAGSRFDPQGLPRGKLKASQLAHILQGAESEALRACIDLAGASLTLLQHDGFTSLHQLDVSDLSNAIEQRIGYRLAIAEERL
jgi:hypothetical protein